MYVNEVMELDFDEYLDDDGNQIMQATRGSMYTANTMSIARLLVGQYHPLRKAIMT
jgi:hypothetical protein